MSRRLTLLVALLAGVGAVFIARALGWESLISQAATFVVTFLLLFGGFSWKRKPSSTSSAR